MSTDQRLFDCGHVTEAADPQWMHDRSREHVREMVTQHLDAVHRVSGHLAGMSS